MEDIKKLLARLGMSEALPTASRHHKKDMESHEFWKTQPVPQHGEKVVEQGPIETKTLADVRQEPEELPEGYEWAPIDMTSEADQTEIYELLTNNYVEDDDCTFRFDYSRAFLSWALTPPGYVADWHVAIRRSSSRQLVGFITGIPADIRANGTAVKSVEINFLCVHKELRTKRIAPTLIKEVTRRVNLRDIWQAAYTAGVLLPQPVSTATYYHRSLNPKKLVEVGFSGKPRNMTMAMLQRHYKLPDSPEIGGLRTMTAEDVPAACRLLNAHQEKFKLYQRFEEEEFKHYFLSRPGVVMSYVVESDGEVTDFFSFYSLPSSIFGHPTHTSLNAAYSYYTVANSVSKEKLVRQALIVARVQGFDVFNMLELMDNGSVFQELKFARGDGNLHYYLYNYRLPQFPSTELGLVLL